MGLNGSESLGGSIPFMNLEQDLKTKVPEEMQEQPEFRVLLETIALNSIRTRESFLNYIQKEIAEIDAWLKKNSSTGTDTILAMTNKIAKAERLKKWKELCEKYL
jgi:ribonuclease HIII